MKILITGVAGFIGSHLAEKLLNMEHDVIGVDIINDYYSISQKEANLRILYKYTNFAILFMNSTTILDCSLYNVPVLLISYKER